MVRPKRRKIFYVPGIISLFIVPLMFIHYANTEIKEKSLYSLKINMANMKHIKEYPESYLEYEGQFPSKRNYIDIVFTSNNTDNRTKLDFAQIRVKEIITENDSINGIHFHFTDHSEWWTFVESVNILYKEDAVTFMPLDNDIWFYHFPRDTTILSFTCGTVDNIISEVSWWEETWNWIKLSWKNSWNLIIAFTVFVFMSIVPKLKRSYKQKSDDQHLITNPNS